MKHVDEYRDSQLSERLVREIRSIAKRKWTLMEVCGGQTHGLLRHGIDQALDGVVQMLHGPGCPVCVTPSTAIDQAVELSKRPGFILASFGDMLRVPGSQHSLLHAQSQGANVRIVYSPLDAVRLAQENPASQVVFFAVGFETTAPATALAVLQAHQLRLDNFTVISVHVRVLPAMQQIAQAPGCQVQGFLAAGHVCTVMGCQDYQAFVDRFHLPVVVTGFEPVDLLKGIYECVRLLESDQPAVINAYPRSVRDAGNIPAQEMLDQVFQIADGPWRGLGIMPGGSLVLMPKYAAFDAALRFPCSALTWQGEEEICPSGQVMTGRILPPECPFFGTRCTPDQPLGAPMVSSEGACAAYYSYQIARSPGNSRELK